MSDEVDIEESYGFGILDEGQAIAVAKNIKIQGCCSFGEDLAKYLEKKAKKDKE